MKKLLFILFLSIFIVTGCGNEKEISKNKDDVNHTFITVHSNEEGKIVIATKDITTEATFVNYVVDDVTIQFIVVRGTDGKVRIAFNTCQSCNPSPNAYFKQVGEYLQCQNCGNKFHIDEIGEEQGGCNPAPVEEKEETDDQIVIDKDYVDTYKAKFEKWSGPTK